jgi:hypothetical protein
MKGLLNFKPILKGITEHASLDDLGHLMLMTKRIRNFFLTDFRHVITYLKEYAPRVTRYYLWLKSLKYITNTMCLNAVRHNIEALRFINSEQIQLEVVKYHGQALNYIENQSELVCVEAVRHFWQSLKFVKNQTRTICLEAIKQNRQAINYVKINL